MGLLLLLTSALLSSYFHAGRVVNAERIVIIKEIILSIEPSTNVTRDTNVTLRCRANIFSSGQDVMSGEYTIYKDSNKVYTKNSSTSEDLLYPLPKARVSNTGKYVCKINIDGQEKTSEAKKLAVTGLSKPVLHINTSVVNEGEEVTAKCTAPGERGSFFFYFYEESKEILDKSVTTNQVEEKLRFSSVGFHTIYCAYTVVITPQSFKSKESDSILVFVRELPITAVLQISPQYKIYEGDRIDISCSISSSLQASEGVQLYLRQGTKLLSSGNTTINHSITALAKDPGEFECGVKIHNVVKVDNKTISVIELFSVPTLTMSPAEVFQKEDLKLTCRSESYASERLARQELTYTLDPSDSFLRPRDTGVFVGKAQLYEFNYTCVAQAKGVVKHSRTLTVRPKVSVSSPKISVVGRAVLGRPFKILCQSDTGSLPINYTLLKNYDQLNTISVKRIFQQAIFTVTITEPGEISKYMCEAKNNHRDAPLSKRLNATVIVPLSNLTLMVLPTLADISEGVDLVFICSVVGSPPVTFKWYLVGSEQPLNITTANHYSASHSIPRSSKEHSGKYYCEAVNDASNVVKSDQVEIVVRLALWKKALIGGFCLLVVSVIVVMCVLRYRSKRGKREATTELSVKPSSPKSDDSLPVNLTYDTEVYNAATDAAPLYHGMEGRVTNGARDSAASLPADISNRSSYSIPATV